MAYDKTIPDSENVISSDLDQIRQNFALLEAVAGLDNWYLDEDSTSGNLLIKDASDDSVLFEFSARSTPPSSPSEGDFYLDDGSNTESGNVAWRVYNGASWVDIGGGTGDKAYTYTQESVSDTWNINHGLGKKPSITIVDSSSQVVMGDVEYIDDNNVTVTFDSAFAGKAFLN